MSGGKDPTVMALLALETYRRKNCPFLFADTGNEHDETLDYVHRYLPSVLGRIAWSTQRTIDYVTGKGVRRNPLYSKGMRRVAWLGLLMTGYALSIVDAAWAAEVWVITDRQHPIHSVPGVRLIELDAPSRIEADLSRDLPADAAKAATIATQRLKDDRARLQQLAAAYQAVVDAWSLGIVKIPAVVVDRQFVVYGEPDVERALQQIARHRSEQR
jgi:integrating conjugative element protein (TIGR03757 family)